MDLTGRLLLLLDVVERGSYAKAAELREIDRSVVSKQIAKLEQELGVRLLNRTTRSFALTEAGSEVVNRAQLLRQTLAETVEAAKRAHQRPTGVLKIATMSAMARHILRPVILAYQQRYPEVVIELRVDNRMVDIVGEGFDIAFRIGELQDSTLIARSIARTRQLLVASPGYLARHGTPNTLEQLQALPAGGYVVDSYRETHLDYLDGDGQSQQLPMNIRYYTSDIELLLQHAVDGQGLVLVPSFLIRDEIATGRLVAVMTQLTLPDFHDLYAVYPHRDLPRRTRLFLDAVMAHIGDGTPVWERRIPGFDRMYGHSG
ncbi:LysR family transcriptional regulator [Ferrimonas marina]|uniref:DNA-binding transcriptional regulator, LysR family n=1 Tax=Ferrimonas marina TaxID=299255 RepID=A0A1M5NAE4_9GAMM|nr:LysR family transcriptional regulator [Ferrimonas marina]SHG85963.1 DNA-binding transcriptional regulator, LysR family [Ferrimonas marina]